MVRIRCACDFLSKVVADGEQGFRIHRSCVGHGLPVFRGKKTLEDGQCFRTHVMLDALRVGAGN